MKKETMLIMKKIFFIGFVLVLIIAIIHIAINAIRLLGDPATSFPWYSSIFFTGIYYVIPLLILFLVFRYFSIKSGNK